MPGSLVKKIEALRVAEMVGCRGAHQDEDGNWAPCSSPESLNKISMRAESDDWIKKSATQSSVIEGEIPVKKRKKRRDGWNELGERGIIGITATPGVGISSTSPGPAIGGKAANIGPEYVRDNDQDVFADPESARARSRQLGCIGISRRISKTGRAVWMPCTNMSDYSRLTGSTSLGRRGKREQERSVVRTILREELGKLKRKKSILQELSED